MKVYILNNKHEKGSTVEQEGSMGMWKGKSQCGNGKKPFMEVSRKDNSDNKKEDYKV